MSKKARPEEPQEAERAPYKVRGGFTVHLGNKVYRAGQIVDLTAAEAKVRRHQIEFAPDQAEPDPAGSDRGNGAGVEKKPASTGKKTKGGDSGA